MGLALALNSARTSLAATSTQIAVTARNTAGASDPFYTRKIANLVAAGGGSAVSIQRATDTALFDRKLAGTSSVAASEAVLDGLTTPSARPWSRPGPTASCCARRCSASPR